MQYTTDPKTGSKLSILGFSCMRLPRDRELTEKLVINAVNRGINYFDTAYVYGNSETILGDILDKNGLRNKVYLATKLPHMKCNSYDDFERIFQKQQEHLKTDYFDYYLIHNISDLSSWQRVCNIGIEKWIDEKKSNKQIRQIGFSFHGALNGFMDLIDAYNWDFCQIQYNYMDENYQAGRTGLHRAHEKGLPVIIMEPLLGGKLATGLTPKALRFFKEANEDLSAASWAFRWLWNQNEVTIVLSGMNSTDQLEDNLKTAETAKPGMLSEKEYAVFSPVITALREAYKVPCTGCNYCMPCPNGINIPGCLAAYNTSYVLGFASGFIHYITSMVQNNAEMENRAGSCIKCGACEKKCPQHIQIIKSLGAVKKRLEQFWFTPAMWLIRKSFGL